jgi:hypothetical protein
LEHCTTDELNLIRENHTTCFLDRLKNESNVVDKIRQNYNDDQTIKVDFKKVCAGEWWKGYKTPVGRRT